MICDFVCNVCGKQFKSQKTLTQHIRDVHIEEDIPCSLCDKTFRTISILLTTTPANTKKRNLCSVTNAAMITFKRVPDYLSEEEEEGQIIAH